MPNLPPVIVDLKLRARYMLAGAIMLGLWAASLIALFRGTDGVNIMMVAVATITLLPLGAISVFGAISGSEASMGRARSALFAGAGLMVLVIAVEVARRILSGASH